MSLSLGISIPKEGYFGVFFLFCFETVTHCLAQAGLKLNSLLSHLYGATITGDVLPGPHF